MHHFEQHPSRMTLEMIKVPGAQRRDGTKGEGNSSPNPENRMNFPPCSLRKIDKSLVSDAFFSLSFLKGEAGELRKERRCYQEGNAFRVSECQRQCLPCSWHWGLQTDTHNSSTAATVWNPGTTAESPWSHRCHHPVSL